MLDIPEDGSGERGSSVIYFKVDDIQSAYESLVAQDVTCQGTPHLIAKMPDHDLWMAFFRDPDENLLALMSEVHSS
jgi:methylmalonyl-CoA/ethylmalonyl-CoA epimerase